MKAGDVVTIKTIGGDEIIARLSEILSDSYKVLKPFAIMITQQGLSLAPYVFSVSPDTKIDVRKSAVVFIAKTDTELANQYISSTTGIKLA